MRVIVADTDYGRKLYDASTPEAWAASSLHILTQRFNDDMIFEPGDFEESYEARRFRTNGNDYTDEQMAGMPEDFKARVNAARRTLGKARMAHLQRVKEYKDIRRVVEEQDTSMVTIGRNRYERQVPLAWRYLEERSDHESEEVELVQVKQPHMEAVEA